MQKYGIMTFSILIQIVNKNELFKPSRVSNRQKFSIVQGHNNFPHIKASRSGKENEAKIDSMNVHFHILQFFFYLLKQYMTLVDII